MDLLFSNPGLDYSVDSIMLFQNEEQSDWWRNALFEVFPQLNRVEFDKLEKENQREYLKEKLYDFFTSESKMLEDKLAAYNNYWKKIKKKLKKLFLMYLVLIASVSLMILRVS